MDALEAILTRRSIRSYTARRISKKVVDRLLAAAMSAPSAGNEQPWHFVTITDRRTLTAIPRYHPYSQMLNAAPMAILVCGDLTLEKDRGLGKQSLLHKGFWVQDCSAATENLLIAAHAEGLGAVWLAVYPLEDRIDAIRKLLRIPDTVVPFALVSLGYPAEQKPPANRYSRARVHYNQW